MLATYMRRMRNNNLEIRIPSSCCRTFCIPYIDKWYPFHVPSSEDLCIPLFDLIAVNALSLKYEQITKPDSFPDFITAILLQCICWPF